MATIGVGDDARGARTSTDLDAATKAPLTSGPTSGPAGTPVDQRLSISATEASSFAGDAAVPLPACAETVTDAAERAAGPVCRKVVRFDPTAAFLDDALDGNAGGIRQALAEGYVALDACIRDGITALHNACCGGHEDIVEMLVLAGANVNAVDADGWTPLHLAACFGTSQSVAFLIEHGANLSAVNSDGATPEDLCEPGPAREILRQARNRKWQASVLYALYDYYTPVSADEVALRQGDSVRVISRTPFEDDASCNDGDAVAGAARDAAVTATRGESWWLVACGERTGLAPSNYLGEYRPAARLAVTTSGAAPAATAATGPMQRTVASAAAAEPALTIATKPAIALKHDGERLSLARPDDGDADSDATEPPGDEEPAAGDEARPALAVMGSPTARRRRAVTPRRIVESEC